MQRMRREIWKKRAYRGTRHRPADLPEVWEQKGRPNTWRLLGEDSKKKLRIKSHCITDSYLPAVLGITASGAETLYWGRVFGMDLVEIAPKYDVGNITTIHAERLICNFIGCCPQKIKVTVNTMLNRSGDAIRPVLHWQLLAVFHWFDDAQLITIQVCSTKFKVTVNSVVIRKNDVHTLN